MNLFPPKIISFVVRNMRSLIASLSNRTNNIMDPNADVVQSKIFLDLFLEGLLK
jgi:hypothetical protein